MPVICAATGCNNKFVKGSEIRFYRFPLSKPQLASKWVHSLGMKNFIPTANTCLCSEHFRPDCFRDYNGKQFLREDAVPTLFTNGQDSSKIELRKRGVVPKETNVTNKLGTQTDQDRAREAANQRRDKRGGIRGIKAVVLQRERAMFKRRIHARADVCRQMARFRMLAQEKSELQTRLARLKEEMADMKKERERLTLELKWCRKLREIYVGRRGGAESRREI